MKPIRKRVLMLLTNAFDPDPRVHREASALSRAGYDVALVCWDRDRKAKSSEIIDGIQVERIFVRSTHGRGATQVLFLLLFWLKAFRRALAGEFAVAHAHDFDTLPLAYLLSRVRGTPLVYDAHESFVDMKHDLPAPLRRLMYFAESWLLRRADVVITVGELLREHFAGRRARRAVVVGNWQDYASFRFDAEDLQTVRRQLGVRDGRLVVCFIANLGRERQVPQLVEAARRCRRIHLILGGGGPCRDIAEKAAAECSNVSYVGPVHPSRVPLYTAASDVVFYGFDPLNPNARFSAPNKLFEALAAGKVVVTANFGEIGKIVADEGCGIVLPDYSVERIVEAFESLNPLELARFGEKSRNLGERKYNWEIAGRLLVQEYDRLLKALTT